MSTTYVSLYCLLLHVYAYLAPLLAITYPYNCILSATVMQKESMVIMVPLNYNLISTHMSLQEISRVKCQCLPWK